MKRSLEISEEYEKNPGLNIGRLKGEVERQISQVLLISGLILVVIEIVCGIVILLLKQFFQSMTIVCFGTYAVVSVFLLYAGISSASMLRSIYTDEFTTCVKKVWLILTIFVACIILKIVIGCMAYYQLYKDVSFGVTDEQAHLMFVLLPLVWELLPIFTVYYMYSRTVIK